jgi:hypothetical protein
VRTNSGIVPASFILPLIILQTYRFYAMLHIRQIRKLKQQSIVSSDGYPDEFSIFVAV